MELWIATSNAGKISEFKSLLAGTPMEIKTLTDLKIYSSPPENGTTFEQNARIKAKSLKAVKSNVWIIADDSGLEVEGLNNMPGIHSARYAGPKASDAENTAKLLKMMEIRCPLKRDARFRCVMVAYSPEGQEYIFEGELKGFINSSARGNTGFGYDSVFIPEGEKKTLAELGPAVKNRVSHRAQAIRKFRELL